MKRRVLTLVAAAFFAFAILPALALAAPRSGSSFGGRRGFRAPSSSYSRPAPAARPTGGGGPSFIFFPGFGWGWGGYGAGGSMFGSLLLLGVLGVGAFMIVRAVRRARAMQSDPSGFDAYGHEEDDAPAVAPGRAYVYKVQLGLGRSARGIQERLAKFAAEGDTSSEEGLANLLHQTGLELMREKHSIRYAHVEADGPMSLTNGETKLNAAALAERSRFQIERVRGAEGQVRRADTAHAESDEALEYLVVTLVIATRKPMDSLKSLSDAQGLDAALGELGAVPPNALLGLEVVWTPADPTDSMTEADLLTTYPQMRGL